MQDEDKSSEVRAPTSPPASQSHTATAVVNGDCTDLLQAIRERASGLRAPVANGHAANYQAWVTRAELDECSKALGQLSAMVDPQQEGAERLAHDVSELHITLSRLRHRL